MAIKIAKELADMCAKVATEYKTLYVTGCFGAPLNEKNKQRWMAEYEANRLEPRKTKIVKATSDTFGFDCVNFIKAVLWGWNGDVNASYGGAEYQSGGVPDIDEGAMFAQCTEQSTDFAKIQVGEAVWMQGHIGIYIGDDLAVECTPAWKNGVQITACNCSKAGYNSRYWTKHGKLPYVEYDSTLSVGDVVDFLGDKHYVSAWAADGRDCKSGKAKITAIAPRGIHRYHLMAVSGGGSDVYGWVDADAIRTEKMETVETCKLEMPVLSKGSKSARVKAMQTLLIGYGYTCGSYGADGDFGAGTEEALRNYQREHCLAVDGVCGGNTWSSLLGIS